MALDGRSTEFTTANLRDLEHVDRARLNDAFERFAADAGVARPDQPLGSGWTIVLVGDAGSHRRAIEELGYDSVTVLRD
jgi:hypothetical protein